MCFDGRCDECLASEECLESIADRFVGSRCQSCVLDEDDVNLHRTYVPCYVLSFFLCELIAVPGGYFEVAFSAGSE